MPARRHSASKPSPADIRASTREWEKIAAKAQARIERAETGERLLKARIKAFKKEKADFADEVAQQERVFRQKQAALDEQQRRIEEHAARDIEARQELKARILAVDELESILQAQKRVQA